MNLKQASIKLNSTEELVVKGSIELFGAVPKSYDAAHIEKLSQHLSQKQLPQTGSLSNQNSGNVSTNDQAENLNIFSQERTEKRIKRLYEAGSMVGKSEAQAFNTARNDAFLKGVQGNDDQAFYDFINGAIQHTIHNSHFSRNVDRLNGKREVQEVQIESFEQPTDDSLKYLTLEEDNALARGWAKLLNPGQ